MDKKHLLSICLEKTGAVELASRYRKSFSRSGIINILAYHRVLDIVSNEYPFDENIISASVGQFDRQMAYVKANFDVLTFSELYHALQVSSLPKRPLIITFDDGYRDNYLYAYPIIKRHGLPATFFLTTGYIGHKETFWFEKVAYWIKNTRKKSFRLKADHEHEYYICDNRKEVVRSVQTLLKNVNETIHEDLIEQLENQLETSIMDSMPVRTLSWEEVREMSKCGIEFGSHSVSHLNLAAISKPRLMEEIYGSKATIEKEVGVPVITIAYPFGGTHTYNPEVQEVTQNAGYIFGVTNVEGIGLVSALDRFALRRIAIERDVHMSLFRALLELPNVFLYKK